MHGRTNIKKTQYICLMPKQVKMASSRRGSATSIKILFLHPQEHLIFLQAVEINYIKITYSVFIRYSVTKRITCQYKRINSTVIKLQHQWKLTVSPLYLYMLFFLRHLPLSIWYVYIPCDVPQSVKTISFVSGTAKGRQHYCDTQFSRPCCRRPTEISSCKPVVNAVHAELLPLQQSEYSATVLKKNRHFWQ